MSRANRAATGDAKGKDDETEEKTRMCILHKSENFGRLRKNELPGEVFFQIIEVCGKNWKVKRSVARPHLTDDHRDMTETRNSQGRDESIMCSHQVGRSTGCTGTSKPANPPQYISATHSA